MKIILFFIIVFVLSINILFAQDATGSKKYLKGQLHMHTNLSDGDASPIDVAKEYKEMGYDFAYFTDHYQSNDVSNIKVDGFLALPGAEWGAVLKNPYYNAIFNLHVNTLGKNLDDWGVFDLWKKHYYIHYSLAGYEEFLSEIDHDEMFNRTLSDVLTDFIEAAYKYGTIPIVNHPNWITYGLCPFDYRELLKVDLPYILEIKNASDGITEEGYKSVNSVEYTWDVLLSNGKNVLCTFDDDAHNYSKEVRDKLDKYNTPEYMVPGKTFVMVKADLNQYSIENALRCGDFYASTGVELEEYKVTKKSIYVKVKDKGKVNNIIFKGKMGLPLKWVTGNEAEYIFTGSPDEEYVRVKIADSDYNMALTQPVFQNGKKIILINK
ncbi:MAG: hypothetical protein IJS60_03535 [Abditibacteriota bacterium]|nr:hypothetical protein [Abditibacteriota bacterium]